MWCHLILEKYRLSIAEVSVFVYRTGEGPQKKLPVLVSKKKTAVYTDDPLCCMHVLCLGVCVSGVSWHRHTLLASAWS